jgi:hypothetical protein
VYCPEGGAAPGGGTVMVMTLEGRLQAWAVPLHVLNTQGGQTMRQVDLKPHCRNVHQLLRHFRWVTPILSPTSDTIRLNYTLTTTFL